MYILMKVAIYGSLQRNGSLLLACRPTSKKEGVNLPGGPTVLRNDGPAPAQPTK